MIDYEKWLFAIGVWIIVFGFLAVCRPVFRFYKEKQRDRKFR